MDALCWHGLGRVGRATPRPVTICDPASSSTLLQVFDYTNPTATVGVMTFPGPQPVGLPHHYTDLHPNLARLVVQWEQIAAAYQNGEISSFEAARRMEELRATDDQGVRWVLTQEGRWMFINSSGALQPGEPPTTGIPAPAPEDFTTPDIQLAVASPLAHFEAETQPTLAGSQRSGAAGWVLLLVVVALMAWMLLT